MKNRNYVSTLSGMEGKITSVRRDGNSTRLVDNAIQIIFSGDICVVEDHCKTKLSSELLYNKIIRRLMTEHLFMYKAGIYSNKKKLEIGLRSFPDKNL